MGNHHKIGFFKIFRKGNQFAGFQFLPVFVYRHIAAVCIIGGISVTGKMLDAGQHTRLMKPVNLRGNHTRNRLRIA